MLVGQWSAIKIARNCLDPSALSIPAFHSLGVSPGCWLIHYRQDIRNIRQEIEKEYGVDSVSTYFGDTPDKERQEIVKRFQDPDNSLRFFVGNQQTAGYGLTLTAASTVVYYSNNYDLEKRIQSEG